MAQTRRWRRVPACMVTILLGLALWPAGVGAREALPGVDDNWRRYESPHFELFSRERNAESRDLLYHLELLHTVFIDSYGLQLRQPLPVTIYYFQRRRDFDAYAPASLKKGDGDTKLMGFYSASPERAVIVVPPLEEEQQARQTIFHEYIHHLTRVSGENPPMWYTEGVAELFSTLEVEKDGLIFGRPLPWHIERLQQGALLPLGTLFAIQHQPTAFEQPVRIGQFYAESWALLHCWFFGNSTVSREKIAPFLEYIRQESENGDPARRAALFEQVTGIDYTEMEKQLAHYVRSGRYRWVKLPSPPVRPAESYASRAVSRDEIRLRLAELHFRVNEDPGSRLLLLQEAEKADCDPRVLGALGADAWKRDDRREAQERWARALDRGETNPAVIFRLAQVEARGWFEYFNVDFRLPDDRAERLRDLLRRSIAAAPHQIEAYEILAWVEATARTPVIANVNRVQAQFATLRQKDRTLLALALVRVRLHQPDNALKLLDGLPANVAPWVAQAADAIRAHIAATH